MAQFHAKRLGRGRYLYRGFIIHCCGYFDSTYRNVWEVIDHDGSAFGHSGSLRESKRDVDEELEREQKRNGAI